MTDGLTAPKTEVTIVIPNHNGRHLLAACLESISTDGGPLAEIVVVDNASSDDSVSWLEQHWPEVRVVAQPSNRGYAAACNAGAAASRGRVIVFVNNDVVVRPGWSAALVRCLDVAPDIVIAGGLTLLMDDPTRVNTAGIQVTRSLAGVDAPLVADDHVIDAVERDVAAVSGVSLAVDRAWFDAGDGFDEEFFMYYEDLELCLRAWVQGHRVRFTPESVILHAAGATAGGRDLPFRHFHTTRNRLLCAFKLLEPRELPFAWGLSLISDVATVSWHAAHGRPRLAARISVAKIAGAVAAVRALPRCAAQRQAIQRTRRRSTRDLRRLGLIESSGRAFNSFIRMRSGARDR